MHEYHRAMPPERMPFAYRASDLFIGPSRAEEGFGLPVLEALASGLPCLLSDTPGTGRWRAKRRPTSPTGIPRLSRRQSPPSSPRRRARGRGRTDLRAAAAFDPGKVAERLERAFARALENGPASKSKAQAREAGIRLRRSS